MSFWDRLLSQQTARFILALLALLASAGGAYLLLRGGGVTSETAATFALGQLFALATMSFGYYFGSTARNDDRPTETRIVNKNEDPIPVRDDGAAPE